MIVVTSKKTYPANNPNTIKTSDKCFICAILENGVGRKNKVMEYTEITRTDPAILSIVFLFFQSSFLSFALILKMMPYRAIRIRIFAIFKICILRVPFSDLINYLVVVFYPHILYRDIILS